MKILTIEDHGDIRRLIAMTLEFEGHTVIEVPNGEDGLSAARSKKPDAILLDVMMPGMDGAEVCKMLKMDAATKHIPVIMISAVSDENKVEECMQAGAYAYIVKPFKPLELLDLIEKSVK